MKAQQQSADGRLPEAKRRLEDAVSALVDPRQRMLLDKLQWSDAWYMQLVESVPGDQGQNHNPHPTSVVPFWVDAVELLREIDTAVWCWQRDPGPFDGDLSAQRPPTPETVRRLWLLEKSKWKVEDVRRINQIIEACNDWCKRIEELLNPIPTRTLWAADGSKTWAACPACGESFIYKRDPAGDKPIRVPTLQMTDDMATVCVNRECGAEWGPQRALFLCKVLGYPVPEGVQDLCQALGIPLPPATEPT